MADPVGILTAAIDIAKKLREVAQKTKDADAKNLIADLSIALADAKTEVAALKDENLGLRTEIKRLSERPDLRSNLEFRDNVYYLEETVDGRPNGPYCPRCWDAEDLSILLTRTPPSFKMLVPYGERCAQIARIILRRVVVLGCGPQEGGPP